MNDPKLYGALLNAVVKREYEGDTSITPQFIKEAVFAAHSDISVAVIEKAYSAASDLISRAAYEDYDPAQLEAYLKLKRPDMAPPQREAFGRFWRSQRSKVHEEIRKRATWDNTLERMAWRMDVRTRTMASKGEELSDPIAIVELHVNRSKYSGNAAAATNAAATQDVVRFELDRDQIKGVLDQVTAIERDIQQVSGSSN